MTTPSPYGGSTGGYYLPKPYVKPKPKPTPYTVSPKLPTGTSTTVAGTSLPWYMNPSANARPDTQYDWQPRYDQTRTLSPADQAGMVMMMRQGMAPNTPPTNPFAPGSGGSGGGGGGGGGGGAAAGPEGLDQATLDWLFGQIPSQRPQDLAYNPLDLPDARQFYGNFDTSQYDIAGQGVNQGIEAMRQRGNQAFDFAQGELGRYQNPYAAGPQQANPDLANKFGAMAQANDSMGAMQGAVGEGVQADQAMRNAYALMAGNDQSRQAANLRALQGDRQTMDTNLGLEGTMLGLGVNMAKAKGQSQWEQMIRQAQYDAANTEASQNWQRGNTVGDTNVGNRNAWNSGLMQTLLSIVGAKAPGTTLPGNYGGFYV